MVVYEPCNACEALVEAGTATHNVWVLNNRFTIAIVLILILFILTYGWLIHIERYLRKSPKKRPISWVGRSPGKRK